MVLSNFAKRGSMDVIKCLVKLIAATMRRVTRPLVKVMKTSETPSGTVKNCSSTNAMTRRATVTLILWQLFLCFRLFFFFTDCSRPWGPIVSGPIEPSSAKARYFTRMAIDTRLSFKGQPSRQLFEKLFVSSSGRGKSIRFFAVFASDSRFPIYSSTW